MMSVSMCVATLYGYTMLQLIRALILHETSKHICKKISSVKNNSNNIFVIVICIILCNEKMNTI